MSALPNEDEAYRAFQEYAEAKQRVEQSMLFTDALAAGRAWRVFLNLFVEPEDHMELDTNVVPFPKRGRR